MNIFEENDEAPEGFFDGICVNCDRFTWVSETDCFCQECLEAWKPNAKPKFDISQKVRLLKDLDYFDLDEGDGELPKGVIGYIEGFDAEDWQWEDEPEYRVEVEGFIYDIEEHMLEAAEE